MDKDDFVVIGENIHTTRSLKRNGKKVQDQEGVEGIPFVDIKGNQRFLKVPEWYTKAQPYQQGQIKHFMIAVSNGINGNSTEAEEGREYIVKEVAKQIKANSRFLDLNVDEISYKLDIQKQAMKWLVQVVGEVSTVPVSIDSSNSEIISEGLGVYTDKFGAPMINSLALERPDTIDLVVQHHAKVIATAAGEGGMPSNATERLFNVSKIMDIISKNGIPLKDVYIDALVFPISVDPNFGNHYFDAVNLIRKEYGPEIHITGGLSNVSFGLPKRQLINKVFIALSISSGIDSGIIDPIQNQIYTYDDFAPEDQGIQYASDMLLGKDDFCMKYLEAFRGGFLG